VSGSVDTKIMRWDENGRVIQTFSGHSKGVADVIELKRDIIAASSIDDTATVWKVSTGQLLQQFTLHSSSVEWVFYGLVKLSEDAFVTGSKDNTIRVWNAMNGECVETIATYDKIDAMTRVRESIVTVSRDRIEVRRLKYASHINHHVLFDLLVLTLKRTRLIDLCCVVIATNKELYNIEELEQSLPEELYSVCFGPRTS